MANSNGRPQILQRAQSEAVRSTLLRKSEFLRMPAYSYLLGSNCPPEARRIEVPEDRFKALLSLLLTCVQVDESWYLGNNPDVREAVDAGIFSSGREHFVVAGYFEGRWPQAIKVDEAWYAEQYPDVRAAISNRTVSSGQDHFNRFGFLEGRMPSSNWSFFGG